MQIENVMIISNSEVIFIDEYAILGEYTLAFNRELQPVVLFSNDLLDQTPQNALKKWITAIQDNAREGYVKIDKQEPELITQTLTGDCVFCGATKTRTWWKCCPVHTTEYGPDFVCEECKQKLHPDYSRLNLNGVINKEQINYILNDDMEADNGIDASPKGSTGTPQ